VTPNKASRIHRAVNYLVSHYTPKAGLIYESEDEGVHWLRRVEYPDYHWSYQRTFWLYSDNLLAAYALQPYAPEISKRVNGTINSYDLPPSNHFEAILGYPVGSARQAQDIIIKQTEDYAILIRIHNGTLGNPLFKYADNMLCEALSKYYRGQETEAQSLVREVYDMWNGTCLVDSGVRQQFLWPNNAPSDIDFGLNFKLALLLYAVKVTGTDLPDFEKLEEVLWSKQQANGGITTLSTGHGEPVGSANAETTALTLLIYNDALISRIRNQIKIQDRVSHAPLELTPYLALVGLAAVVFVIVITRKRLDVKRASIPNTQSCCVTTARARLTNG
jgi:hypothetical protein